MQNKIFDQNIEKPPKKKKNPTFVLKHLQKYFTS